MTRVLTKNQPRLKRVHPLREWLDARGISYDTAHRLAKAGKLRLTQLSPGRLGVHEDDDAAYLESCRQVEPAE
jgi:predicted site-specific integrase-resolvase